MRFNDLLQTVLASPAASGAGAVTLWRQCVDLLAQNDRTDSSRLSPRERTALIHRIESLRFSLTEAQRLASVVELGSWLRSPALIELFGNDRPAVCVAAMTRAQLEDRDWPDLIARLTPTARGVLRGRRDLGEQARTALDNYGRYDLLLDGELHAPELVLDQPMAEPDISSRPFAPPAQGEPSNQIRELVDRIARYQASGKLRQEVPATQASAAEESGLLRHFPFETDAAGTMTWVGKAPRASLIGLSIAEPALPDSSGPDAAIAAAFARRDSFRNGRFRIAQGAHAGEWRLSALPFFDQQSGRFQGYRGEARRPMLHEVPYAPPPELAPNAASAFSLPPEGMRQLIHELRTPLNAILGFAEIIEQQMFGPTSVAYREMAGSILSDARRLLETFDDLDNAARAAPSPSIGSDPDDPPFVEDHAAVPTDAAAAGAATATGAAVSQVEVTPLLAQASRVFQAARADQGEMPVALTLNVPPDLPAVIGPEGDLQRLIQQLMRSLAPLLEPGEPLTGAVWHQPGGETGQVILGFDRPRRIRDVSSARLLEAAQGEGSGEVQDDALGLGFALRLVRHLATSLGGEFLVASARIMVALPAARTGANGETATPSA